MKKVISIVIVAMLLITTVFADSVIPEALTKPMVNYTADYSVSMTFDNSEQIAALLEEIEIPEEIGWFVEVKDLLKTLFDYDGKMNLQADFSENYDKIKLALTVESAHFIDVNSNLNFNINQKTGIWVNMDLSNADNPVFEMIFSHPLLNKYFVLTSEDILKYAPESVDTFKATYNKEYIDSVSRLSVDLLEKYATVKGTGSKYTITIDNDGFTAIIDEIISNTSALEDSDMEMPAFKGWQILGEKGIECIYTLRGGKISSEKVTADISLSLDRVYLALTGEEWNYTSADTIDFTIETSANITKIGSTKVVFPALTEENSFTLADVEQTENAPDEESVAEYPYWYIDGYTNNLPVIDGEVYVPLRRTIVDAYEDSAVIDYKDGAVTITSEYFPGFDTIKFTIDTDKAYTNSGEYTVGKIFTIDGSTYVSNKFFCDILGWELSYAQYDIIENEYSYGFWTTK